MDLRSIFGSILSLVTFCCHFSFFDGCSVPSYRNIMHLFHLLGITIRTDLKSALMKSVKAKEIVLTNEINDTICAIWQRSIIVSIFCSKIYEWNCAMQICRVISSFDYYYFGEFVIRIKWRWDDWRNLEIHSKICDFHLKLHLHQEKNYLSFAPSLVRAFLLNWWTYHVYSIKLSLSTLFGDKTITIDCHTMNICEADKAGGQASRKEEKKKHTNEKWTGTIISKEIFKRTETHVQLSIC